MYGWAQPTMCEEAVLDISQGRYVASAKVLIISLNHSIGTLFKSWSMIVSYQMMHTLLGVVATAFNRKLGLAQVQMGTKLKKRRVK
jgi:hypothetical protein